MNTFFVVLGGLLLGLAWCGLSSLVIGALISIDEGGIGSRIKFLILLAIWLVATAALIAGGWEYLASHQSTQGSCKLGHYETGAKGQRYFFCDVYYPLPQVEGQ